MRRLFIKLLHTITGRVTVHVALFSIVSVVVIFTVFLHMEKRKLADGAARYTLAEMDAMANHIYDELHAVEIDVDNYTWMLSGKAFATDSIYEGMRRIIESNEHINSCTLAFAPDYYKKDGLCYAPYAARNGGGIDYGVLDVENREYEYLNWFIVPTLTKAPYWDDPSEDHVMYGKENDSDHVVVTYSKPLYDDVGKMYAVVAVEVSLHNILKVVNDMKLFPNSFNVLLDRKGIHIAHPDSAMVLHQSFFAEGYGVENEALKQIRDDVAAGRSGYVYNKWNDSHYYLFYKNLKVAGWEMISVCPAGDVVVGVERYAIWASVLAIAFLIMVVVVCRFSVRYVLHPIEDITVSMRRVARGKYDNELVPYNRKDEVGRMRRAFVYMQKSLSLRNDKMRQEIWEQEKVDTDMRLAEFIRHNIMQMNQPVPSYVAAVEVAADTLRAKMMAGDMYQYLISGDKLYFMLMGVSARGTLASVIQSTVCRIFRAELPCTDHPEQILDLLNRTLAQGNKESVFCPVFIGIINLKTGAMDYCNAGHLAPVLLVPGNEPSALAVEANLPVGAFQGTKYAPQSVTLQKGTVLCLYSDGVIDAVNADLDLYGEEHLLDALKANAEKHAEEIVRGVVQNVSSFVGSGEQKDDATVMVVRYC